jgi:hypothetical protein
MHLVTRGNTFDATVYSDRGLQLQGKRIVSVAEFSAKQTLQESGSITQHQKHQIFALRSMTMDPAANTDSLIRLILELSNLFNISLSYRIGLYYNP